MKIYICDNCNTKVQEKDFFPDLLLPLYKTITSDGKGWHLFKKDLCSDCVEKIYNALKTRMK